MEGITARIPRITSTQATRSSYLAPAPGHSDRTGRALLTGGDSLALSSDARSALKDPAGEEGSGTKRQDPLATPMYYRNGSIMTTITFEELLHKDSHELGELWPRLGMSKYGLFPRLEEKNRELIEKKLLLHAYDKADIDFSRGDRWTFDAFGRNLRQIPSLQAMDERDRAGKIYGHYLDFMAQNGVTFPLLKSPLELFQSRENPVAAIREGRGRCGEFACTLRQMFNGAGISCDTVEAWESVKKDWKGLYRKDRNGIAGSGVNHTSVTVGREKDGSPVDVYDPAMCLVEQRDGKNGAAWKERVSWKEWVTYFHHHGWTGKLNVFVDGDRVREDYQGER